jgi:hypothetical protein
VSRKSQENFIQNLRIMRLRQPSEDGFSILIRSGHP